MSVCIACVCLNLSVCIFACLSEHHFLIIYTFYTVNAQTPPTFSTQFYYHPTTFSNLISHQSILQLCKVKRCSVLLLAFHNVYIFDQSSFSSSFRNFLVYDHVLIYIHCIYKVSLPLPSFPLLSAFHLGQSASSLAPSSSLSQPSSPASRQSLHHFPASGLIEIRYTI